MSDQQGLFEAAFAKAKAKRSAYYGSEETDAFRIVNGEGDHLGGLTIDLYREFAVFSGTTKHCTKNKSLLIQAFQQVFPEVKGAVEKSALTLICQNQQPSMEREAPGTANCERKWRSLCYLS